MKMNVKYEPKEENLFGEITRHFADKAEKQEMGSGWDLRILDDDDKVFFDGRLAAVEDGFGPITDNTPTPRPAAYHPPFRVELTADTQAKLHQDGIDYGDDWKKSTPKSGELPQKGTTRLPYGGMT